MLRAQELPPLFAEVFESPGSLGMRALSAAAARRRLITLRQDELARVVNVVNTPPGAAARLRLNLFADADFSVSITSSDITRPGAVTFTGRVEGIPDSLVFLSTEAGVLSAFIQVPGSPAVSYEVTPVDAVVHIVRELDQAAFPGELAPIPVVSPRAELPGSVRAEDTAALIDVLVMYTPAARAAAGGTAGMNTLIDNAQAATNTAYANSAVTQRIRIVHRAETAYVETSNMGDGLAALQATDGAMDEVHALRNAHGADLVALLGVYSDACGLAFLMNGVSTAFAPYAFSVTGWSCAVGNLSFPHELGHNMGLHHDEANAGGGRGAYTYSYGYRDPGFFRTVMAYPCASPEPGCPRVGRFSTPSLTYNGRATGTASTNNALTLDQTAATVANFRHVSYYLAEGATNFFTTDVLIANPNPAAVPVIVTFLKPDGSTVVQSYTIGATSRRTIRVNGIAGVQNTAVSTTVTSTTSAPLVVERTMAWDDTAYGGHGEAAVSGPATMWYFAEGSQGFFDTYLLLANTGATPASVTVNFLTELGGVIPYSITVGPTSRQTIHAGSIASGQLAGKSFSIVVNASQPITAERAMYFGTSPFWTGGHDSAGVTAPATTWFHAEGATGPYFDSYILVGNPNQGSATVTFTYLLESGATVTKVKTVPGNTRLTVRVASEDARLADAAISTSVTSTLPIVSERAMYWPGASSSWVEAHNSFGITAAGTRWGLAEGRVGGAASHATYILLLNPGSTAAEVRMTFLRTDGTSLVATRTINPTSRLNVDVGRELTQLANEEFSTILESTNGVPFVVERSMYWNVLGVTWAAGTNAAGTRIP